jgi:N-acetyl-anhydromuramyl-L-alanine amidase AmpD
MLFTTKDRQRTDYIVVTPTNSTPSDDVDLISLDRLHRQGGFISFRYHYLINRNGKIEQGSKYYNDNSIFIALVGGKSLDGTSENNFTPEQLESLEVLTNLLKESYPTTQVIPSKQLHPSTLESFNHAN